MWKKNENLRKLPRNGNLRQIITDVCMTLADMWHKIEKEHGCSSSVNIKKLSPTFVMPIP